MAQNNLFDQINIRGYVDGWARRAIEVWRKELRKKKIGVTDKLYKSFEHQLVRDKEDLMGVLLKFNYYGRLVDMGVGRGLKAYERGTNKQNRADARRYGLNLQHVDRKRKPWFNKPKTAQIYRLRELLASKIEHAVVRNITDIMNAKTEYSVAIHE